MLIHKMGGLSLMTLRSLIAMCHINCRLVYYIMHCHHEQLETINISDVLREQAYLLLYEKQEILEVSLCLCIDIVIINNMFVLGPKINFQCTLFMAYVHPITGTFQAIINNQQSHN